MGGDQQVVAGAGERHVEEPAVFFQASLADRRLVVCEGLLELLAVGDRVDLQHRETLGRAVGRFGGDGQIATQIGR